MNLLALVPGFAAVHILIGQLKVLNVRKEELPEERESSFSAVALATGSYAILLT